MGACFVGGRLAAPAIVPTTGLSASEMSNAFEFQANETWNSGSRSGEAHVGLAIGPQIMRGNPWEPGNDPNQHVQREALALNETTPAAGGTGDRNPISTLPTRRDQAPWKPTNLQLLDALFAESSMFLNAAYRTYWIPTKAP